VSGPTPLSNNNVPADLRPFIINSDRVKTGYGPRRGRGLGQSQAEIVASIDELNYGPQSLPADAVPIDLHPRLIQQYKRDANGDVLPVQSFTSPLEQYLSRIADDTGMISSTLVLNRGLLGRTVTITTTPQLIINAEFLRGYIILNPNDIAGATNAGTLLASQARGAATADLTGNSATLGVANFLESHFFVDISAIDGGTTLTLTLQALDPVSGLFADVQDLVTLAAAVGTTYVHFGQLGIATDARVRWVIAPGNTTFSVGFVLKNGILGTSSGISQTIYLGGAAVTTVAGFPLLNGQKEKFFLRENVQLFAVASTSLPLKIFEL
jgi:hypothetical protein